MCIVIVLAVRWIVCRWIIYFCSMLRLPPRSTQIRSSVSSDVYKRIGLKFSLIGISILPKMFFFIGLLSACFCEQQLKIVSAIKIDFFFISLGKAVS